jgi:hypothetical protein
MIRFKNSEKKHMHRFSWDSYMFNYIIKLGMQHAPNDHGKKTSNYWSSE